MLFSASDLRAYALEMDFWDRVRAISASAFEDKEALDASGLIMGSEARRLRSELDAAVARVSEGRYGAMRDMTATMATTDWIDVYAEAANDVLADAGEESPRGRAEIASYVGGVMARMGAPSLTFRRYFLSAVEAHNATIGRHETGEPMGEADVAAAYMSVVEALGPQAVISFDPADARQAEDYRAAVNAAMSPYRGANPDIYGDRSGVWEAQASGALLDQANLLGAPAREGEPEYWERPLPMASDAVVTIPATDPNVSGFASVLRNGVEGVATISGQAPRAVYGELDEDAIDVPVWRNAEAAAAALERGVANDRQQRLKSRSDAIGMTRLRPFMTEDEWREATRDDDIVYQMMQDMDAMASTDADARRLHEARADAIDRAAGLLRYLDDTGRHYRIRKNKDYVGQVTAHVDGTDVEIRIIDRPGNERNIGTVVYGNQKNPVVVRNTTVRMPAGESQEAARAVAAQDPARALDALKFALGDPLDLMPLDQSPQRSFSDRRGARNNDRPASAGRGGQVNRAVAQYAVRPVDNGDGTWSTSYEELAPGEDADQVQYAYIRAEVGATGLRQFRGEEQAEEAVSACVEAARANFAELVDVEGIVSQWVESGGGYIEAETVGVDEVDEVRSTLANYLSNYQRQVLMRPGHDGSEYREFMRAWESPEMRSLYGLDADAKSPDGDLQAEADYLRLRAEFVSECTYAAMHAAPEEQARYFADEALDEFVGTVAPGIDGRTFDPVAVAVYADSEHDPTATDEDEGQVARMGATVSQRRDNLIAAAKAMGLEPEDMRIDDSERYVGERMMRFDEATARPMSELSPFMAHMGDVVVEVLEGTGLVVDPGDVRIDAQGIVSWKGAYATSMRGERNKDMALEDRSDPMSGPFAKDWAECSGFVGRVFEPDEKGVVTTVSWDGEERQFVPGMRAYMVAPDGGEGPWDRTRFVDYERQMETAIRSAVRRDSLVAMGTRAKAPVDDVCGLDRIVYSKDLQRKLFDPGWEEERLSHGFTDEDVAALIKTQSSRVLYDEAVGESGVLEWVDRMYSQDLGQVTNDADRNAFALTGGTNMALISPETDGLFDPVAKSQSSKNQLRNFYLADGVQVDPATGVATRTADDARTAVMKLPYFKYAEFDAYDRVNMALKNFTDSKRVCHGAMTAQMCLGGLGMEDAIIVSKEFAESMAIAGADDEERALVIGDKMADFHGNKGVIGAVVDPDMTDEEGIAKYGKEAWEGTYSKARDVFAADRRLQCVFSPFSGISRLNGGNVREMAAGATPMAGGGTMSPMELMVLDATADTKSHSYGTEELREGHGRKVSAQYGWSLSSHECSNIFKEVFGKNAAAMAEARAMLRTIGLDMDDRGTLSSQHLSADKESRHIVDCAVTAKDDPALATGRGLKKSTKNEVSRASHAVLTELGDQGGFVRLPFSLTYGRGRDGVPAEMPIVVDWSDYFHMEGFELVQARPEGRMSDAEAERYKSDQSAMYVPASKYRRNDVQVDGQTSLHDYTRSFMTVLDRAHEYMLVRGQREVMMDEGDMKGVRDCEARMASLHRAAQATMDGLTEKVFERSFGTKHNVFADKVMSKRVKDSATLVLSGDPTLRTHQVALGRTTMAKLGLEPHGLAVFHRDPLLKDYGMVAFEVVEAADDINGMQMNPVSLKRFQADLDGDTMGCIAYKSAGAREDMESRLALELAMLDRSVERADGTHPILIDGDLDCAVGFKLVDGLQERFDDCERRLNDAYADGKEPSRQELVRFRDEIDSICHEALDASMGQCRNDFSSPDAIFRSVMENTVGLAGKGSEAKARKLMDAAGYEQADGRWVEREHTLIPRAERAESFFATAAKSETTALGGFFAQTGVVASRTSGPGPMKATMEISYLPTQKSLQIKHDPVEARNTAIQEKTVMSIVMQAHVPVKRDGKWADGGNKKIKPAYWAKQAHEYFTDPDGMGMSEEECPMGHFEQLAQVMTGPDGYVVNPRGEEGRGGTLDKLCYCHNWDTLLGACDENRNVFDLEVEPAEGVLSPSRQKGAPESDYAPIQYRAAAKGETQAEVEDGDLMGACGRYACEVDPEEARAATDMGRVQEAVARGAHEHRRQEERTGVRQRQEERQDLSVGIAG